MADAQEPQEPSKSALKKAEKQAKQAAEKAAKALKQASLPVGMSTSSASSQFWRVLVGGKKQDDIMGT